jgi:uncharacterized coiled-coil protein SlyX
MALKDNTRGLLGTLRALPGLNRRLYRVEQLVEGDLGLSEENHRGVTSMAQRLAELEHRVAALSHQLDHLNSMVAQVDPVATAQLAVGVRDSVRELTVELTEQANQTSQLLAEIADRQQ